jgi:hypothetical protein
MAKFVFSNPMKHILLGLLISFGAFGQDSSEEALILNQELKYLSDTVADINLPTDVAKVDKVQSIEMKGLESQYFEDETSDQVSSKTSAPKRRRY